MELWVCCGLIVLLGMTALIGKVLWETAAAVFNALTGEARSPPLPRHRRQWCPGCEQELRPTEPRCPKCGLEQESPRAAQLE
ncbi:MAG TPA: hypothetical protein VD866_22455, partial [Urbifossiella sp.]|nr:hypothetical protein [Urbifossiella sp.]